jgi:hypothetical protein
MAWSLALPAAFAAEQKTDLTREVYVEQSGTNFHLAVKIGASRSPKVRVFELSAPVEGKYTLLCFIDGKIWSQQKIDLPGQFKLNTSGMASGSHRVTVQAVDASAQVGRVTQTIKVD